MVKCGDWGCTPNPYSSHIHIIYIKGVWQPLCFGCAYGCVQTTLRLLMSTELLEFCHKSWQVSADIWWWNEVIEAVDPTHIHLTSILYIYKVFDNLYMLWMCIWMCTHHVMVAHADLAFGILREIWATPRQQVMVKCSDWGCTPNPYSSHIKYIYIKGVWQPLYAVDVHMDVYPPRYGCSCRPTFWILSEFWATPRR